MLLKLFGTLWRWFKAVFTLKGILTVLLLAVLTGGMLFAIPTRVREPRFVAPVETSETLTSEPSTTPRMAIVIVGLGGEARGLDALIARLLALNVPLTYGVLPGTTNTKRHAELVGSPPGEVDLQLPVSFSKGRSNTSPGRVEPTMRRRQIARQVIRDIYGVGGVAGIAVRGGYAPGKTDAQMMRIVMAMARRRNLYFLDVDSNSAAARLAGEIDLQYLKPDIVLDKVATADAVRAQISVAINKALSTRSNVLVLAHLLPVTVNSLGDLVSKIREAGVELATVSRLNASAEPTIAPSLVPTSPGEQSPSMPLTSTIVPSTTPQLPGGVAP